MVDFAKIESLKRLVLIALFSDDYLMENLVLKGGNALDLVYKITSRASFDLDFSILGQFKEDEMAEIEKKILNTIQTTFNEQEYHVFDLKFLAKPTNLSEDLKDFWGGYQLEFKFIENDKYTQYKDDIELLRRFAVNLGNSTRCQIDISKFEYCKDKKAVEIDGFTIYVYSPEMIVFEKLRSICQQMPEYKEIAKTHLRGRARDFFDIYTVFQSFSIDLSSPENIELLKGIFAAKRVPLSWIGRIKDFRDYHEVDFVSVQNTIKAGEKIEDFDFYFDFVEEKFDSLKTLGEV